MSVKQMLNSHGLAAQAVVVFSQIDQRDALIQDAAMANPTRKTGCAARQMLAFLPAITSAAHTMGMMMPSVDMMTIAV